MLKRCKDRKGAVAVMASIVTVLLLGFTALAVDVGMVIVGRNQLQNAVDSASLAAASKLDYDPLDYTLVRNTAKEYGGYNKVLGEPVVLQDSDIQIFDNEDIALRSVRITGYHTVNLIFAKFLGWNLIDAPVFSMGNPVNLLFFANALGFSSTEVTAASRAGLIPLSGTNGTRPWAIRDKCLDVECIDYIYPEVGELVTMKYGPEDDRDEPFWFAPVCAPPSNKGTPQTGANPYRELIKNGYNGMVEISDVLRVETGNMRGPTLQGVNYLMNQDPLAYYDAATKKVMGSSFPENQSPRIIKVPFYDPNEGVTGHQITVTRIGAFFLEGMGGSPENNVLGRFIENVSSGKLDKNVKSRVFAVGLLE